ncbi:leucine-rich repeat-containing protein 40-like isoform X1 [Macrosteles quadrilineatus]|uniref:leucine-rich repeat-containing protein 40-like isoform X1 n=1 Tax=Macrosteles quadrilineatus TaxID=74068 RepID=UPI0023E0D534|nr:leucine-rich repeat-containing protein 40-like isoform X1 [Macrosteles quadrilineatus]XP_054279870.1 leucine-rich repeat-containing protein 40-like isoform X1 [Macrosteles quadrilineatus]
MTEAVWSQYNDLQKIDLSHKAISVLTPGISECEGVETLYLQSNSLTDLPADVGDLRCLKVLNLNNNSLTSIPSCIFKLHMLTELTAKNNCITSVNKDVGNLCDLNILDISHNELITLTSGVGFLNRLKHVNLSNNKLKSIPHELTAICGLVEIDVSCNKIRKLPCVRNLLHLKVFRAKNNLLKKLPDFSQCRELVTIDFSQNILEDIDDASLNCQPFLKEVHLQSNKLKWLPEDFCNLSSLQVLDLSSNKLNTLPPFIVEYPNLQVLRIANNPFKDIPLHYTKADTLRLLTFLRERATLEAEPPSSEEDQQPVAVHEAPPSRFSLGQLRRCGSVVHTSPDEPVPDTVWENAVTARVVIVNLSHCKQRLPTRITDLSETLMELHLVDTGMKELPPLVGELKELQVLILDQNLLSSLCPELTKCKYLKELSLACNRFSEVPKVVFELKLLRTLNLSNNQLADLSSVCGCESSVALENLQYLETLNISNNEIFQLPPQLGLMTNLKSLEVTGNKFRQPSYHIVSKGTEAILAYLKNKLPEEPSPEVQEKKTPTRTPVSFFVS